MRTFLAMQAAVLGVILVLAGASAADPPPALTELSLSPEEQRLLIAEALRVVQHEDDNGRHTAVMDRAKGHRIRGGGSSGIARGDFNGDGFADLAVGIPAKRVSGLQNAGAVVVIYGSANGRRERRAVPGSRPTAWNFGRDETILIGTPPITFPLVVKATDLAIGAPDKAVNGVAGAGTVTVLYGSVIGDGLVTTNSQSWAEGQTGIPTTPSAFDGFGAGIY